MTLLADPRALGSKAEAGTLMYREAAEAGSAVRRMLVSNADAFARAGAMLRACQPSVLVTVARGSSDHAATFGKYLIESLAGVPTASAAPSVSSIYDAPVNVPGGSACIAISQSGRSPDLLASVAAQKQAGAIVMALVNDEASPLAGLADVLIPLQAGPERSVAATKSYICSLAALAALVAAWTQDGALADAVAQLPDLLPQAFALDWSGALPTLASATNLFVIGRGYGFAVAQEAALKLKETCGLHGEAFSSAEVRHGPMAIVNAGFPVLAFANGDAGGDDVRAVARDFAGREAAVMIADSAPGTGMPGTLPALAAHPAIEPILMIQSFYRFVNALSLMRGHDPDAPPHLAKVTRTQ